MYAYPVHSSVPAPRTAARASWKSAASGCLAWGLKTHPIVTGTAVLALSGALWRFSPSICRSIWPPSCCEAYGQSSKKGPSPE